MIIEKLFISKYNIIISRLCADASCDQTCFTLVKIQPCLQL